MRTRWRFGSKRRLVATIEWLRLFPKLGFFPQTAQTLDIGGECSGWGLVGLQPDAELSYGR